LKSIPSRRSLSCYFGRKSRFGALLCHAVRSAAANIFGAHFGQAHPGSAHPSPSFGDRRKDLRLVFDHPGLLLGRKQKHTVTFRFERERGEDSSAHSEVSLPEMGAFDSLRQGQCDASKIRCSHGVTPLASGQKQKRLT
jgi:hypothetical protein